MAAPGWPPGAPAGRSHGANQGRQGQQGSRIRQEGEREAKPKWGKSGSKLPPLEYFKRMKNKALCPVIQGAEPSGELLACKRTPPRCATVVTASSLIPQSTNPRRAIELRTGGFVFRLGSPWEEGREVFAACYRAGLDQTAPGGYVERLLCRPPVASA